MNWGSWDFRKSNLKWYEYAWAALPLALVIVGGALGGICGAIAGGFNLKLMQGNRGTVQKYLLTGLSSATSIGVYVLAAAFLLTPMGLGLATSEGVEQGMQKIPLYGTIKKTDPDMYAKIRDALTDAVNRRQSQAEIGAAVHPFLVQLAHKYLPVASDQALIQFANVIALETDQIGAKSPDACFEFLNPQPGSTPVDTTKFVTTEVLNDDQAATNAVIQSGASSPQPTPTADVVAPMLRAVREKLVNQYGETAVAGLAKPTEMTHDLNCRLTSALYKEVLLLPSTNSGLVLRYMFSRRPTT